MNRSFAIINVTEGFIDAGVVRYTDELARDAVCAILSYLLINDLSLYRNVY